MYKRGTLLSAGYDSFLVFEFVGTLILDQSVRAFEPG